MTDPAEKDAIVVVVVEDEALIRLVLVEAFRDEGFDVIEAFDAVSAVAILHTEAPRVHALFTDVHMPGDMDGVGLAHHARHHWPWIALLITSGRAYPKTNEMPTGTRFIPKPYNLKDVANHVRQVTQAA